MDPYFFGAFGKGLQQTTGSLLDFMREREKTDEQKKEADLRTKMLDLQIKKEQRAQEDAQRQQMAVDELAQSYGQPQPFARPPGVEGPLMESGAFGQLPADPRMAAMLRAQPKEAVQGLLRQQLGQRSGVERLGGFDTLDQLKEEARRQGYTLDRARQDPYTGKWIADFGNPVNIGSDVSKIEQQRHLMQYPGDIQGAAQAAADRANRYQYEQGGYRAMGGAEAELAPRGAPLPPMPGMPQRQIQPMQPPLATPARPSVPTTSYPSSARPGISRAQERAEAGKTGANVAEAKESLVGLTDAMARIDELDLLSKNLAAQQGEGAIQQGIRGATQYAKSFYPASNEAIYESRKMTLGEALARNVGGVKGTATEGDIYRMLTALPKIYGETEVSRSYKINAFKQLVKTAINNKERFIRGEPIDLEAARREFGKLVDKFVAGTMPTTSTMPRVNLGGRSYIKGPDGNWREE